MTRHPTKKPKTRGRKPSEEGELKSRVIQTRVPKELEDTLKHAAEKKRMTVSHLIRNVLDDTFNLVDGFVNDSSSLVENVTRDAKKIAATARGEFQQPAEKEEILEEVEAWQDVIVNKACQCLQCETVLKRGNHAFRGISTPNLAQVVWLCHSCIENLE